MNSFLCNCFILNFDCVLYIVRNVFNVRVRYVSVSFSRYLLLWLLVYS